MQDGVHSAIRAEGTDGNEFRWSWTAGADDVSVAAATRGDPGPAGELEEDCESAPLPLTTTRVLRDGIGGAVREGESFSRFAGRGGKEERTDIERSTGALEDRM